MSPRLPRRQSERRGLRLWHVGLVLFLTFAASILVAAAVFYAGWDLLGARGLKREHRIDSQTLFDLVKLSFGVVAGSGALVALVVAYRRQRVDEDGALREATRLHTERFTTAVTQLGDESAAVRLGGVHALAGLADDAPTTNLRQTCIDILCAYLRLPYTAEADLPADDEEALHAYRALREVRHTVIRLIRDHLRLPIQHQHSWQGRDLDFTGVRFDGGDFSRAVFSEGRVSFDGATFSGGAVDFHHATFSEGTVSFSGAKFLSGTVNFDHSTFSRSWIVLHGSTFSGATVAFDHSTFSMHRVDFEGATLSGGTVNFDHATFSEGMVDFRGLTFSDGTVTFDHAKFLSGSTVDFGGATLSSGTINLDHVTWSGGTVDFTGATGLIPGPDNGTRLSHGGADTDTE